MITYAHATVYSSSTIFNTPEYDFLELRLRGHLAWFSIRS